MESLRHHASFLLLAVPLAVAGCWEEVPIGGDDGGTDAGLPPSDGDVGEACGSNTCAPGQVCCNDSCGICTDPGESCTTILCLPDGGPPTDAPPGEPCGRVTCGAGQVCCNASCGICTPPDGTCIALECDDVCGGIAGTPCGPSEYCDYDGSCGVADQTGICLPRPDACTEDCPGVCGCDGNTYCNACQAAAVGMDVISSGPCGSVSCEAMDAHGDGLCDAFFGYAWTGRVCSGISGCSCTGADCSALYADVETCERMHDSCVPAGGDCGGFAGLTCRADEWCDYEPTEMCGAADALGTCRTRPDACDTVYAPVCGCDSMTYGNACSAHAAGIDDYAAGPCAS